MKPTLKFLFLAAALSCGFAKGQTTAYTTPVGYITHSIAAETGGSAETYISPTLVEPTVFAASSLSAEAKVVSFSGTSVPTNLDSTYVLEITSGPSEGWWSTVQSSTSGSITLVDDFPVTTPVAVSVRKHSTLKTFFGDNRPGFITYNGSDPSDEIQIFDPITQQTIPYAYISGADLGDPSYPNGAWWDLGGSQIATDAVIVPGSAIRIKRVGGAMTFTSTGTVKTTKTQVDVYTGFNWIGTPLAAGGTLDGMTFNSQLVKYDGSSENFDELSFLDANQSSRPFAAIDGSVGATMFDLGSSEEKGTEPFQEGTGVVIKRIGNPASTITLPGTSVSTL